MNGVSALIDHGLSDCSRGFGESEPTCAYGELQLGQNGQSGDQADYNRPARGAATPDFPSYLNTNLPDLPYPHPASCVSLYLLDLLVCLCSLNISYISRLF